MKVLEVKNLEKSLSGKQILNNVSFSVKAGEVYGFLGPNGAGKTTTMKSILGLINIDWGSIKILGQSGLTLESKHKIGFMPENTYLYKYLTWREFLRFNGKFFDFTPDALENKIEVLLKKVWLQDAWDKPLKTYSKGMLQRVWLAQSIINDPEILFLDEPMGWLDPIGRKMVRDLLLELKEKWTTIFFNTHILADVEDICDKISIIHKWNIIVESKKVSSIKKGLENFFVDQVMSFDSAT